MGNVMVKLVMFSIMLNMAAGITMVAVVDIDGSRIFDRTVKFGFTEEDAEQYDDTFQTELEQTIKPAGSIEDKGDQIYRVLDVMSLGFLYKFINVMDTFMFGFVNIIDRIVSPILSDDVNLLLFGNDNNDDLIPNKVGIFKTLITISYIITGIKLFTGKDVVEGT